MESRAFARPMSRTMACQPRSRTRRAISASTGAPPPFVICSAWSSALRPRLPAAKSPFDASQEEATVRVALYARVSDPRERRGTIESQIELLEAHARENGYEVAPAYVCRDRYTGAELARPELDRLRDGAQAGAFDAVLVHDPDRLSRKYAYQILIRLLLLLAIKTRLLYLYA